MATTVHRGLAPVRQELPNGATIIAQHTATHRAVTIHASVAAGSGHDADTAVGTANFVARAIDRGTHSHSTDALAEAFDGRGVSLTVGVARHLMTFSCTCLADDVEEVLGLVASVSDAQLPAGSGGPAALVGGYLDPPGRGQPGVVATETLMAALYPGGHPYGRRAKGTMASVQASGATL